MTDTLTSLPGLDASAPEPLPFAPDLHVRAFVLRRTRGDVLVYAAPAMRDLGAVSRWYLNHRHEAMFAGDGVDAPLFMHEGDRGARRSARARDVHPPPHARRGPRGDPDARATRRARPRTCGTAASTASCSPATRSTSRTESGSPRCSTRATVSPTCESLELIRGLDFDVLVPWAATAGQPFHAVVSAAEKQRRIDAVIERVRRGERR